MLAQIRNYSFYGGVTKEEYALVQEDIRKANRTITILFSGFAILFVSVMYLLSFHNPTVENLRPVYAAGVVCAVLILLSATVLAKKYSIFSYLSMYFAISAFLLYGIVLSVQNADRLTVTFMVMMLLMTLIFVDKPIRLGTVILFYMLVFIVAVGFTKEPDIRFLDIIDTIIYGTSAIVCSYIVVSIKIQSYVMRKQLQHMSETDQLTGLNNRNCYESKLDGYETSFIHSITCIYIDVNGLHTLNNTKGHKAGDEMLCFIAQRLQYLFGERDTYRIGGDEYVVFAMDADEEYIVEMLKRFSEDIEAKEYHAAVGYEYVEERCSIRDLVESAEKKMYVDKKKYYETHER